MTKMRRVFPPCFLKKRICARKFKTDQEKERKKEMLFPRAEDLSPFACATFLGIPRGVLAQHAYFGSIKYRN